MLRHTEIKEEFWLNNIVDVLSNINREMFKTL